MVYINFPRTDLNTHSDLTTWRAKLAKTTGDWTLLKLFLRDQGRFFPAEHTTPKCWYTELWQGDDYALDVEHFRPKRDAQPLNATHLKKLKKRLGYDLEQNMVAGTYDWLEHDYRNYRLTTAFPNRGGAKHIYFPVAAHSTRLQQNELPWVTDEYNLLLDPVNRHDAHQLLVLPDGKIIPRAPKTLLSPADFSNYQALWTGNGFNYLRATISIVIYQLDKKVLVDGREQAYRNTTKLVSRFYGYLRLGIPDNMINDLIGDIVVMALPSAQFALAVRSALAAFSHPQNEDPALVIQVQNLITRILQAVDTTSLQFAIDWSKP